VRTLKLILEYDGTAYCGWQRQGGAAAGGPPSVQAALEKAVLAVTGEAAQVVGAGRTDAGVHALGQVAHLTTQSQIQTGRFPGALNAYLPPDIRLLHAEDAPPGFHARFDAVSRTYRYEILNRPAPSALLRHRAYHVAERLDVEVMQRALAPFTGRHDFAAYRGAGSPTRTTVCAVTAIECVRRGPRIRLTMTADRFLRHMARMIVGTLVRVGTGRLPEDAPGMYLSDPDNHRTGPTAPAQGLYLVQVEYGLEHPGAMPRSASPEGLTR
jgi:tRNA pseudouridine38-40 synthase